MTLGSSTCRGFSNGRRAERVGQWVTGADDETKVLVERETDDDRSDMPRQIINRQRKALGKKPATVLVRMHNQYPGSFQGPADQTAWNTIFEVARVLASWGPTIIDDFTDGGIHHFK